MVNCVGLFLLVVQGQAKQPLQGKLCGVAFMGVRGQAKQPFQGKLCGVVLARGSRAGKTTFPR